MSVILIYAAALIVLTDDEKVETVPVVGPVQLPLSIGDKFDDDLLRSKCVVYMS